MPIVTAFTISSIFAVVVNTLFLLRTLEKKEQLRVQKLNGELAKVANTFVNLWIIILTSDLLVLIAGVGLLTGVRWLGYLLAAIPLASTLVGVFALKKLLND
jgi:hypothetical protein